MLSLNKLLMVTPVHLIKQSVVTRAIQLAHDAKAQLTFFSATEEQTNEPKTWKTHAQPKEFMTSQLNKAHDILQGVAEQYRDDHDKIDIKNETGPCFIETIKKVKHDDYDFVVLPCKEAQSGTKHSLDSNAMHLMRKCPCPVWAVAEQEPRDINTIVALIDVYAPTKEGMQLNESILRSAMALITKENQQLHIVHAWQQPDDDYLTGWGFTSEIDRCEMIMQEQHDRQNCLDDIVANNIPQSLTPKTQLLEGNPQEIICNYVNDHKAELIVMGTVCHTNIPGYFIGSVAESILNEVCCSVLALKPQGFISPVE